MGQPTVTTTLLHAALSPARVLVVGAGLGTGAHALWSLAAERMGEDTFVVGYDLPGHGASAPQAEPCTIAELADAVVAAVARLRDEGSIPAEVPVFFAGVSLNGCVALQLALDHADEIAGVAVICSAARIGEPQAWRERAELVERAGTPTMVAGSAERWFAPGFIERHPERATALLHTLQEADRHSYARLCEALGDFDVRERLATITVPVLTVHGAHDTVTPPAAGEEIAAAVHGTTVVTFDDAAHQAPLEQPEATAEALRAFLAGAVSGGQAPIGHQMDRTAQEVLDAGMAVRREVLGGAHVDRAEAKKDETTEDFQNLISRYAWGTIWTRPGLDRRMRSAVTITAMVSGGYWDECAMHLRAALRNGLSREEIREILLQTAIYASVPAANIAFALAQRVFAEVDEDLAAGRPL